MRLFGRDAVTSLFDIRYSIFVILLSACGPGDGNGNPTGTEPPTPLTIAAIQPIFTNSCAFSGCHGGAAPQLDQHLGAGQAHASIVNVPSVERPGMDRVEPGQPDASYLVHKIQGTHLTAGGSGERMPLGGAPLSQAQIDSIRAWIADGALNN